MGEGEEDWDRVKRRGFFFACGGIDPWFFRGGWKEGRFKRGAEGKKGREGEEGEEGRGRMVD